VPWCAAHLVGVRVRVRVGVRVRLGVRDRVRVKVRDRVRVVVRGALDVALQGRGAPVRRGAAPRGSCLARAGTVREVVQEVVLRLGYPTSLAAALAAALALRQGLEDDRGGVAAYRRHAQVGH